MGRMFMNLKRIFEKIKEEGNPEVYQLLLDKFVVLYTYEDTYLMNKCSVHSVLRQDGNDMFLDCGGFGIIVDEKDNISIHT